MSLETPVKIHQFRVALVVGLVEVPVIARSSPKLQKSLATVWPVATNHANNLNHFSQTFSMNLSKTI